MYNIVQYIPSWIDPMVVSEPLFLCWLAIAYFFMIVGNEWITDGVCTLALASKVEPLFVGMVVSTIITVVPLCVLVWLSMSFYQTNLAVGSVLGGSWGMLILPLAVAGLERPIGLRDRWVKADFPMMIVTVIVFFCCICGGRMSWLQGAVMAGMGLFYIVSKYTQGKDSRYGLEGFGRGFTFGISTGSVITKIIAGGAIWTIGGIFWILAMRAAILRWNIPALPLGIVALWPLCLPEITSAIAATQKGYSELILGQVLAISTLFILVGGAIICCYQPFLDVKITAVAYISFIAILLACWFFMRYSHRLWGWQSAFLLFATFFGVVVIWIQGCGGGKALLSFLND